MKFELSIESRLGKDSGKTLRKYDVNGEQVVGVWGDEPFAIRVKNHTGQRVEAKVSLDGTDIATGGLADASPTGKRWVIDSFSALVLSAWPESANGGASFVFGQEGASVAAHTHGNMQHRGVIAVAIFTERAAPVPVQWHSPGWFGGTTVSGCSVSSLGGDFTYSSNSAGGFEGITRGGPAVGAGSFTQQRITTATGLREPRLSEILHLRYMWWDDLRATLSAQMPSMRYAGVLGFPAQREDPFQGISLGSTPRVDTSSRFA